MPFLIVIILRKNMVGNSAVLHGPLFYVCVLQQMPLGFEQYYTALKYIISVYSSTLLHSLELFGHIPWCFFEHFHLLQNYIHFSLSWSIHHGSCCIRNICTGIIPLVVFTCGGAWRIMRSTNCNAHWISYEKLKLLAQNCKGVVTHTQCGTNNDKGEDDPAIIRITSTKTLWQSQTTTSVVSGQESNFILTENPSLVCLTITMTWSK